MAQSALVDVDLQLNTKVTQIFTPEEDDQDLPVSVVTSDDTRMAFDQVICTTPLGWLKRNLDAFQPGLPTPLTKAIEHISYGRLEKVYITFPTAFWVDADADLATSQPFHAQFLSPQYATATNPAKWSVEAVNLASLPDGKAVPTLLFYINGPCAAHVTSLHSTRSHGDATADDQSAADARVLDFFRPYYSLLPNYSAHSPECVPRAVLATDWIHDDMAGNGSYTTFQVSDPTRETVELDKDIVVLRHGLPDRRLWFAGEHTSPFIALGTVTGAYWSGEAVARRVAETYGLDDGQDIEVERLNEQGLPN